MNGGQLAREAREILMEHGIMPVLIRGKHDKLRWWRAGRQVTLVVSHTCSDRRAHLNMRAVLRRLLAA